MEPSFVPLPPRYDPGVPPAEAARAFYERMRSRRSVRMFSDRPVDRETIDWLVRAAGSAPSGANKQPWRFVCVQNPELKRKIRFAAEDEEREFYSRRASAEWLRHCTYSNPELFFSYRRSVHEKQADYGRLLSAIRL